MEEEKNGEEDAEEKEELRPESKEARAPRKKEASMERVERALQISDRPLSPPKMKISFPRVTEVVLTEAG